MKPRRHQGSSDPGQLSVGDTEFELGIPIPGFILPPEQWARTALKRLPVHGGLDLNELFGRAAPTVVEIGCGNGRFTVSSAVRRPGWNHLAIDILPAVVRYATRRANQRGLSNVRVAVCDGWKFLSQYLSPGSVNEFHIYHPQPFADQSRAHLRMMTPDFVALLHSRLCSGGIVFLQSDRVAYWDYIKQVVSSIFLWREVEQPWPEDPLGRSRRELLSRQRGLTIYRGEATKNDALSEQQVQQAIEQLPLPQFSIPKESARGRRRGGTWRNFNLREGR